MTFFVTFDGGTFPHRNIYQSTVYPIYHIHAIYTYAIRADYSIVHGARTNEGETMKPSKALQSSVSRLTPNTVAQRDMLNGIATDDPITCVIDALYRYAINHQARYESKLADDGYCGQPWLDSIKAARYLLSSEGKFDAGTLESVFLSAMDAAGYNEADL